MATVEMFLHTRVFTSHPIAIYLLINSFLLVSSVVTLADDIISVCHFWDRIAPFSPQQSTSGQDCNAGRQWLDALWCCSHKFHPGKGVGAG